jgi:23S rRNA pseudouridine1911/1915/1917 synthase
MDIKVIYEDANLIAINKPAGLLVHGNGTAIENTLADWLLTEFPEVAGVGDSLAGGVARPGIVHRLDKDTSGILLVARNQEYFHYLKSLFRNGKIRKTYRAIVLGALRETTGTIDAPISIKSGSIRRTAHQGKDTKTAITRYKVLEQLPGFSYLEVYPQTGRTHQIRVHLNFIGHPPDRCSTHIRWNFPLNPGRI